MKSEQVLKKRVMKEIEKLPENHLREARDYADNLLKKKRDAKETQLDPENDPILQVCGIADVEPFAHKIDEELYGEE